MVYTARTSSIVLSCLSRDFVGSCMVARSNVVDVSLLDIHLMGLYAACDMPVKTAVVESLLPNLLAA
jgi:hypothetical protein